MLRNDCPNQESRPTRVAIYAKYSSDLQRPSSIEDQIRQCEEAAARRGWEVAREYIRFDKAQSGRSLVGRDGLDELVRLAEQKQSPYDGIVIDDTSRFGRNLSDTLPLSDILENANVFLHFANCGLDSRDPNFRLLFIAYGQHDEQASRRLGECVKRGQRGRVLKGYVGSGRVYGYNNVPIEDPTRKGLYGRPYVEGVKLEINPEEAAIVVRIFEMYVNGLGCRAIAVKLNEESVPSPLKLQRGKGRRIWSTFAVSSILTNEKYRGVHIWNRSKVVRNPRTHRKEQRPRPESEWERVDVPQWRIVSDELWNAAAEINAGRQRNWVKLGGLNRTTASRDYVFSGLTVCAECGGSLNVISGTGQGARYGCAAHRYRGTCENSLTIRRTVLEDALIAAMAGNLRAPELRDYLASAFQMQTEAAWKDRSERAKRNSSSRGGLQKRKATLKQQAENILDAIAATKGSDLLYGRLSEIEGQMRNIDGLLAGHSRKRVTVPSVGEVREFLHRRLGTLESWLAENSEEAKQLMLKQIGTLVMVPCDLPSGSAYRIAGDNHLFRGGDSRGTSESRKEHGSKPAENSRFEGSAAA